MLQWQGWAPCIAHLSAAYAADPCRCIAAARAHHELFCILAAHHIILQEVSPAMDTIQQGAYGGPTCEEGDNKAGRLALPL